MTQAIQRIVTPIESPCTVGSYYLFVSVCIRTIAGESGPIVEIGRRSSQRPRSCASWIAAGHPIRAAVNVSHRDIIQVGFAKHAENAFEKRVVGAHGSR